MLIPSLAAGRGSERRRQPKYGRLCMKNDEKGKGVGTGWGGGGRDECKYQRLWASV